MGPPSHLLSIPDQGNIEPWISVHGLLSLISCSLSNCAVVGLYTLWYRDCYINYDLDFYIMKKTYKYFKWINKLLNITDKMELIYYFWMRRSEYFQISHFPQSWHYALHINKTWIILLVDTFPFEADSQFIVQAGPKLPIFSFKPLETRDHRCVLPPRTIHLFLSNTRFLIFFLSENNFLSNFIVVLMTITQMPFTLRSLLITFSPETHMPSNWVSLLVLIHLLVGWSTSLSNFFQDK